jgi:hypothetical protein
MVHCNFAWGRDVSLPGIDSPRFLSWVASANYGWPTTMQRRLFLPAAPPLAGALLRWRAVHGREPAAPDAIPLEAFFRHDRYSGVSLSPDGRMLAALVPSAAAGTWQRSRSCDPHGRGLDRIHRPRRAYRALDQQPPPGL